MGKRTEGTYRVEAESASRFLIHIRPWHATEFVYGNLFTPLTSISAARTAWHRHLTAGPKIAPWLSMAPADSSRCLCQSAGRTSSGNRDGLSLTLQRLDCTATLLLLCCRLSCGVVSLHSLAECRAELLSLCAVMCTWQAAHSSSMCWRRRGRVCQRVYIRHAADSTSDWSSAVRNSHRGCRCK